jgi:hypothetical protein
VFIRNISPSAKYLWQVNSQMSAKASTNHHHVKCPLMLSDMIDNCIAWTNFSCADFYVYLTVHLGIIFLNDQLDAQLFFIYVYVYSLHVSGSHVPIIRRINCINTASGICHSVLMTVWCAHQTVIYREWHIPDVVLTELILLIMGTWLPKTCKG